MALKKNDFIDLKIDNCTLEGSGVGRYDRLAVFVPCAAPGDELKIKILKVKSNCAFGKIEEIKKPGKARIESSCPVFTKCGGCSFCHIDYNTEADIKEKHVRDCFERIAKLSPEIEPIVKSDDIYNYRNKAQFPVEISGGEIKTGFYARHSHRVIDCPDCILQPEEFKTILNVFKKYIAEYSITSYDEKTGKGLLRHIYIRKAFAGKEIMVCPVINGERLPGEKALVKQLTDAVPAVKSIVINSNKHNTNVILGEECRNIFGNGYITDILCGLRFRLSPLSFYQINRKQAEKLYNKVREYSDLKGGETLLDLYCGTGTIGLTLAKSVKSLIGAEITEQAVRDAEINALENGITNARFICSDAAQAALKLAKENINPDVIILDPPRKGCADSLIKTATGMKPDRIIYVSCDPATLARDCAIFNNLGYQPKKAAPIDMFARTGHVETVVLMSRVGAE